MIFLKYVSHLLYINAILVMEYKNVLSMNQKPENVNPNLPKRSVFKPNADAI